MIITCNSLIYLVIRKYKDGTVSKIKFSNFSTRLVESLFSFLRAFCKTNSTLNTETALTFLKLYEMQIKGMIEMPKMA